MAGAFELSQECPVNTGLESELFLANAQFMAQCSQDSSKRMEKGVIASSSHLLTVGHAGLIVDGKYAPVYTHMTRDRIQRSPIGEQVNGPNVSPSKSPVLAGPGRQTPKPDPKIAIERSALLEVNNTAEVPALTSRARGSRYYTSALLPPGDGCFLLDLNWGEGGFTMLQPLLCPATLQALDALHSVAELIVAITLIEPPDHDGRPRAAPLRVDAIAVGVDSQHGCRQELIVRTADGKWHSTRRSVKVDEVSELEVIIDLKKTNALADFIQERKNSKPTHTIVI